MRVTDAASPPDPVLAATVAFQSTVLRPGGTAPVGGDGEMNPGNPAMPVILQVSQSSVATDVDGLASITATSGGDRDELFGRCGSGRRRCRSAKDNAGLKVGAAKLGVFL